MKKLFTILLLLLFGLFQGSVFAQCTAGINFQLIDHANTPSPNSDCTTLTTDGTSQRGCAWSINGTLDFTANFSYDFKVNLGSNSNWADGMCFVVQNDPAGRCACGAVGGAMGAGGITNSLSIEIDTYINTEDRDDGMAGVNCSSTTNPAHMDMWTNGNINPAGSGCPAPTIGSPTPGARYIAAAVPLMSGGSSYNIEDGAYHLFRVSWNAATQKITAMTMDLAATTTYASVTSPVITPTVLFGTNNPYFGFTASTGGLSNQQSFCLPAQFILPIDLIAFSANYNRKGNVSIQWTLANADNTKYYLLESSADGLQWQPCKKESVKVNGNVAQTYAVVDEKPCKPLCYYRLKSVDYNNKADFSYVISVNANNTGTTDIVKSLYPVPAENEVQFTCGNAVSTGEIINVLLYDAVGNLVLEKAYSNASIGSVYSIDLAGLSTGFYQAIFSQGGIKQVNKLSVIK